MPVRDWGGEEEEEEEEEEEKKKKKKKKKKRGQTLSLHKYMKIKQLGHNHKLKRKEEGE